MEELRPDVYRIELPRPDAPAYVLASPDEPIACHVVDGDRTVLFGTGYALSTDRLVDELDELGGVDVVVVEHGDSDHYGALPGILDAYDDVTVAIPAGDAVHLDRVYADATADQLLEDGDTIAGFRAITVRGHTYGNMAFLDRSRGLLVAGDTLVRSDSDIAPDGRWRGALAPPGERFNRDDGRARENIVRLADYAFDSVLLTHGADVLEGADVEFDKLLGDLGLQWEL